MEILNVTDKLKTDNSIVSYEYHSHQPFGSASFDNNDEIRITIPEIDNYTLPCESFLYVEGSLRIVGADGIVTSEASKTAKLINNPVAFMFSDIRYLMNGVQVDSVRNVGLTSCMKGYMSFAKSDIVKLQNAGWTLNPSGLSDVLDANGNFGVRVPMHTLMGFAEDFKKIVLYVRQELVSIRNNDDSDVIHQPSAASTEKVKLRIKK